MKIKVEFDPGEDIREAAFEICQLADRVGVRCVGTFNECLIVATPGGNPLRIIEQYHASFDKPKGHFRVAYSEGR